MKIKILVSGCLLGEQVRYDGKVKYKNETLFRLYEKGFVVSICPEVVGGLAVPRAASEISVDRTDIINKEGKNVTPYFIKGANIALKYCIEHRINVAILKSKSPSCSNNLIYDGTFTNTLKNGKGITTQLLEKNKIYVFNEYQIKEALYMAGIDLNDI